VAPRTLAQRTGVCWMSSLPLPATLQPEKESDRRHLTEVETREVQQWGGEEGNLVTEYFVTRTALDIGIMKAVRNVQCSPCNTVSCNSKDRVVAISYTGPRRPRQKRTWAKCSLPDSSSRLLLACRLPARSFLLPLFPIPRRNCRVSCHSVDNPCRECI